MTGWLLFGGGIVLLYTTSLLDVAASDDLAHLALHAHLVLSGTLFLLPLVGADVLPAPVPHPLRILAILAAVPFHAFVAIALLSAHTPIAPDAYPSLADQRTAAGILWGAGELLTAVAVGIALYAWLQADRRAQRRADRRPQPVPAAPALVVARRLRPGLAELLREGGQHVDHRDAEPDDDQRPDRCDEDHQHCE